ncbi:hypothetical protein [Tenacibaculum aquimarinum]|uniref:hypothetical protein n=1 Tax=Tenacibaculum aquimarinum TaxID=2910675 RepID=UPI001F0B3A00|nr:hypothetical protein [Tenacibaculum aquimarinum]MCH3885897.1 hypothetical protein [Tenacibaculum aquimarinum]
MKYLILLTILIFSISSKAQQETFYVLGKDTVSKKYFHQVKESKLERFYKTVEYKKGRAKTIRLVKRYRIGNLSFQQYIFIKKNIEKYLGKKINDSVPIIISYFHELDKKVKSKSNFKKVKKWITENEEITKIKKQPVNYLKIYDDNSYIANHHKLIDQDWIKDDKSIFKQLFFPYNFEYSSFLIILPDGEYGLYYGKHPFSFILKKIELWNYFDEYLKKGFYYNEKWISLY